VTLFGKRFAWTLLLASLGANLGAAAEPAGGASGPLLGLVNQFLDALVAHDPSTLPFAPKLRATENGRDSKPGEGVWKTAKAVVYRHTVVDPSAGQAVFFGSVLEPEGRALIAVRLATAGGKITESETLVARRGAHPLFSPELLRLVNPIWNAPVAEEERLPRARLIEITNSYFESIEKHDGGVAPFHPDCIRTENGVQTTNNPDNESLQLGCSFAMRNMGYIKSVRGRRYPIVDETRGLVLAIVHFDIPARPATGTTPAADSRTLLLYELFKIEAGRIREIEAFMANAPLGASNGWEK
jgi:hypothetical protein